MDRRVRFSLTETIVTVLVELKLSQREAMD